MLRFESSSAAPRSLPKTRVWASRISVPNGIWSELALTRSSHQSWSEGSTTLASECGKYNQSDPLGLAADLNLYSYGAENPLRNTDPLGLAPRVPRGHRQPCPPDDWRYCESYCGGRRVNGCQTYWAPRSRTRNIRGTVVTSIEWTKTHVERNCDDSREDCMMDRFRRWLDEGRRWFEEYAPPGVPSFVPLPLPANPPSPRPVVPGLPPFFINPCQLNPSLCFGPGAPA